MSEADDRPTGSSDGLVAGPDGRLRCAWCVGDELYMRYHDTEWGFPTHDDHRLFEKLCLEGFQAGLSWLTILRKRENFRAAFCDFDHEKLAAFTEADVQRLLADSGIVRHRGKIEATIHNARAMSQLLEREGSLAEFVWRYRPDPATRADPVTRETVSSTTSTPESTALARDLKRRGWRFVGPTTAYAFMQAMGLVNDHLEGCVTRAEVLRPSVR